MPEPDFEMRYIVVVHQQMWDRIVDWARSQGWDLAKIPDSPDAEDSDDVPSYCFQPTQALLDLIEKAEKRE